MAWVGTDFAVPQGFNADYTNATTWDQTGSSYNFAGGYSGLAGTDPTLLHTAYASDYTTITSPQTHSATVEVVKSGSNVACYALILPVPSKTPWVSLQAVNNNTEDVYLTHGGCSFFTTTYNANIQPRYILSVFDSTLSTYKGTLRDTSPGTVMQTGEYQWTWSNVLTASQYSAFSITPTDKLVVFVSVNNLASHSASIFGMYIGPNGNLWQHLQQNCNFYSDAAFLYTIPAQNSINYIGAGLTPTATLIEAAGSQYKLVSSANFVDNATLAAAGVTVLRNGSNPARGAGLTTMDIWEVAHEYNLSEHQNGRLVSPSSLSPRTPTRRRLYLTYNGT
jgi:hypothetical protein